mmetsp:Transcript_7348/g.20822  ORF Transcript_7348/g.20822 Transcript_7348/m.20822 type:complete len:201 (-) Transcript_7348:466-1068(-)
MLLESIAPLQLFGLFLVMRHCARQERERDPVEANLDSPTANDEPQRAPLPRARLLTLVVVFPRYGRDAIEKLEVPHEHADQALRHELAVLAEQVELAELVLVGPIDHQKEEQEAPCGHVGDRHHHRDGQEQPNGMLDLPPDRPIKGIQSVPEPSTEACATCCRVCFVHLGNRLRQAQLDLDVGQELNANVRPRLVDEAAD